MEARPLSKSRDQILDISRRLFWKYGIRRITVEEICKEGGLSKMTFYQHFKNKHEIARQLIETHNEQSMIRYHEIMDSEKTFRKKVEELMRFKYEIFQELSNEFMEDVYNYKDGGLGKLFDTFRVDIIKEFKQDFYEAQEKGWIRNDINIDFIVYIIGDLTNKILDQKLNSMYPNVQEIIEELTNFFYYGILSKSKNP